MITRIWKFFDITTCIPFIAWKTPSYDFYNNQKEKIHKFLQNRIKSFFIRNDTIPNFNLSLNTKDNWQYGYVTVFGTALDKWDFWAVWRGNKYSGVISNNRDTNIEAVCGKSAFRHGGKIYTILAYWLAQKISKMYKTDVVINIGSQNGRLLTDPMHLFVSTAKKIKNTNKLINFIKETTNNIPKLPKKIIKLNPSNEHRKKSIIL